MATPRTGSPPDSKYHRSHQQGLSKIQRHNSIPLVWVSWAKRMQRQEGSSESGMWLWSLPRWARAQALHEDVLVGNASLT